MQERENNHWKNWNQINADNIPKVFILLELLHILASYNHLYFMIHMQTLIVWRKANTAEHPL